MTDNSYADFALAQSEMKNAELNRINPHFKSKYADLTAVRAATLPALNKYGFAIIQNPTMQDGIFILITQIVHKTGDVVARSEYPLPSGLTPQKLGSELTYARRYAWSSICGICADEDDDGNNAEQKKQQATPKNDNTDQWHGPLDRISLARALTNLANELKKLGPKDTLEFLDSLFIDNKAALNQAKKDAPKWHTAALKAKSEATIRIGSFPGDDPFVLPPVDQPTGAEQAAQ